MTDKARLSLKTHNPDVLTCLANLSSDEIFTPPQVASSMLDLIAEAWARDNDGASIWADSSVRFLDPFTKSGVFLREIARRLTEGLIDEIPDLTERVDHILTKQVYGIAITQITALVSRRSLYCSKYADGEHSIASSFDESDGNIWFETSQHFWKGAKCSYCDAAKAALNRESGLETHAYAFIHTDNIKSRIAEMFGGEMQFDVIVGNPPYHLDDGGHGASSAPIYHKFVEQAKKLEPRFISMVIPARWFSGGKGLDDFRSDMLADRGIRVIEDYPDSSSVFPGTQIKGGVCSFLWERDSPGDVSVRTHDKGSVSETAPRPLLEPGVDVFIRYAEGISVLKKVAQKETGGTKTLALPEGKQFSRLVSSAKPFGFRTFFMGNSTKSKGDLVLYRNGGTGYVSRREVTVGLDIIDTWKVFIGYAGSGSDSFPHSILPEPFVGAPGTISSETYLSLGPFASESEANNVRSYIATRFFRFLVLLHKPTQHATRKAYTFVPTQDFSKPWTDEMLYAKYGLTKKEIAFIESMVRPMELSNV
jgi:hypothetical protein